MKTAKLATIADLKPLPYNPRDMGEIDRERLAESLARFGDIAGLTWNKRTGRIVAGHQRIEALKAPGAVFEDNGNGPGYRTAADDWVPVRVVDWDEAQERAAFQPAGLIFHSEAILVEAVNNRSVIARRPMMGTRRIMKTHQNILVALKGDPKKAAAKLRGNKVRNVPEE